MIDVIQSQRVHTQVTGSDVSSLDRETPSAHKGYRRVDLSSTRPQAHDTMGLGHNGTGTQWDWDTVGLGHSGMGHNGNVTQRDRDTVGFGHNGTGTQQDWDTTGLGHSRIGTQ